MVVELTAIHMFPSNVKRTQSGIINNGSGGVTAVDEGAVIIAMSLFCVKCTVFLFRDLRAVWSVR